MELLNTIFILLFIFTTIIIFMALIFEGLTGAIINGRIMDYLFGTELILIILVITSLIFK